MHKSVDWVAGLLKHVPHPRQTPRAADVAQDEELEGTFEHELPTTARRRKEDRALRRTFEDPALPAQRCVVDNRVFLLGLDALYRRNVKPHERGELLRSARAVAARLGITPGDEPVGSYYAGDARLAEYLRLLRALQAVPAIERRRVAHLPEFRRLLEVMTSPIHGGRRDTDRLLPCGHDALSGALNDTMDWSVPALVQCAHRRACAGDACSLAGIAALAADPVVLAALRESATLYAPTPLQGTTRVPRRDFVWCVDDAIARRAARFVVAFNALFGDDLPVPAEENADVFFDACDEEAVVGRCAALGEMPERGFYHWAVRRDRDALVVEDFWSAEMWSTGTYCAEKNPWD